MPPGRWWWRAFGVSAPGWPRRVAPDGELLLPRYGGLGMVACPLAFVAPMGEWSARAPGPGPGLQWRLLSDETVQVRSLRVSHVAEWPPPPHLDRAPDGTATAGRQCRRWRRAAVDRLKRNHE